jgi:putative transcriptional regulator
MTTISHHLDDEMLMRYSAGTLEEGWSLGVATHLSLCPVCRGRLAAFDSIGGYLLESDESDADIANSWEAMKGRMTAGERDNVIPLKPKEKPRDILPDPLATYVRRAGGLKWRGLGVGASQMVIPTSDPTTVVRLLKVPAGQPVPEHSHGGTELTLVLDGSFSDEISTFRRGDVEYADESVQHTPRAHPEKDCICLAVTDAPLKFKSRLMKFIQPLIGI